MIHIILCEDYIIKLLISMGRKIPNTIKNGSLCNGSMAFLEIAKANQIGAGTVSAIIKQCKLEEQQKKNIC
jgi:hypothetical protein